MIHLVLSRLFFSLRRTVLALFGRSSSASFIITHGQPRLIISISSSPAVRHISHLAFAVVVVSLSIFFLTSFLSFWTWRICLSFASPTLACVARRAQVEENMTVDDIPGSFSRSIYLKVNGSVFMLDDGGDVTPEFDGLSLASLRWAAGPECVGTFQVACKRVRLRLIGEHAWRP